jgi:catalase
MDTIGNPRHARATTDGLCPAAAVERIEAAVHPRAHDRRLHSRGAVYGARFVPSGQIDDLTIASHLRTEVPTVVRFSNGGGFEADDRSKGVRGMAVKFLVDGHAVADLAAANTPTFPARSPEGFVALVELLSMLRGGIVDRLRAVPKLLSILVKYPETRKSLAAGSPKPPASFATTRFDGLNAFFLVDADGVRRAFRYRLVPELEVATLDPQDAGTLPHDFLIDELDQRLTHGSVVFTLDFQFAGPGDSTSDPTIAWPEGRSTLPAGQIIVTSRSSDEDRWQQEVFDPTHVAPGVELSDDPILAYRARAYAISAERRQRDGEPSA